MVPLKIDSISGKIDVNNEIPELNYYFVPVIIVTLGAFFIADVFFGVYEMAVDTLFLCFLEVSLIFTTTSVLESIVATIVYNCVFFLGSGAK